MTKFLITINWDAIIGSLFGVTLCIVLIFVVVGICVLGVAGIIKLFSWAIEEWF